MTEARAYIVAVGAFVAQYLPSSIAECSALVGITLGLAQLCITLPKVWRMFFKGSPGGTRG